MGAGQNPLAHTTKQDLHLALARVKDKVIRGGHDIPPDTILRRYKHSIDNFLNIYIPLADDWILYDNSAAEPTLVAQKKLNKPFSIHNKNYWQKFQESYHE